MSHVTFPKPTPKVRERKPLRSKLSTIPRSVRDRALERAGRICQWCEVPGGSLVIHHKLLRSAGGPDQVENLVAVHGTCHTAIHSRPTEARRRGFIVGTGSNQ